MPIKLRPLCVFTVRRLCLADAPKALGLYAAQGRDSVWTAAQTPETLLENATLWGGFLGHDLCLCGGICSAAAPLPICDAMRKTNLVPADCTLFLPPAATADGAPYLAHFLQILLAQRLQETTDVHSNGLAAVLPVKTGMPLAGAFFAAGFTLSAVRPLFQLRPHYVFLQTDYLHVSVQSAPPHSIMIPLEDTLSLSRMLEEGCAGTGLLHGSVLLCQTPAVF